MDIFSFIDRDYQVRVLSSQVESVELAQLEISTAAQVEPSATKDKESINILEACETIWNASETKVILDALKQASRSKLGKAMPPKKKPNPVVTIYDKLDVGLITLEEQVGKLQVIEDEDFLPFRDSRIRLYFKAVVYELDNTIDSIFEARKTTPIVFEGSIKQENQPLLDKGQERELAERIEAASNVFETAVTSWVMGEKTRKSMSNVSISLENAAEDPLLTLEKAPAQMDKTRHPPCMNGTREHTLNIIRAWAKSENTSQIFWLSDVTGSGKTTVAAHMTLEWVKAQLLIGQFYFSRNNRKTEDILLFCSTIARDIADFKSDQYPNLRQAVIDAQRHYKIEKLPFNIQFKKFIAEPLSKMPEKLILVIDALDQCREEGQGILVKTLINILPSIPNLKLFITSLPTYELKNTLGKSPLVTGSIVHLHSLRDAGTTKDISYYVEVQLRDVLSEEERRIVANQCNGLFIYASTVCNSLKAMRRYSSKACQDLLEFLQTAIHPGINQLYSSVLGHLSSQATTNMESLLLVIQLAILSKEPISINTIRLFLPTYASVVDYLIQSLGGFLKDGHPDRPIHVMHPTFRQFLSRQEFCHMHFVDPVTGHLSFAVVCLAFLSNTLNYDMASLSKFSLSPPSFWDWHESSLGISKAKLKAMKYASRFWPFHVAESFKDSRLHGRLNTFFQEHLLHWIEFLGITGRVGHAASVLKTLEEAVRDEESSNDATKLLIEWCYEIQTFLQANQRFIEESPLLTYSSALVFSPRKSLVRRTYEERLSSRIPRVVSGTKSEWPEYQDLGGRYMNRLSLSSDGGRIAAAGFRGDLGLWDLKSGTSLDFKRMIASISCISFYPDGSFLATSVNGNIFKHDGYSGIICGEEWTGHTERVTCMKFIETSGGTMLISASEDGSIRFWNAENGASVGIEPKTEHSGAITCLEISVSENLIATGSTDTTIRLWYLETAEASVCLSGHQKAITALSFVSNGCILLSLGGDGVKIWNTLDNSLIFTFESGENVFTCMKVSSSEKWFTVGCENGSLLRYGMVPAFQIIGEPIQAHQSSIESLAFSKHDEHIISSSLDGTIRFWDAVTGSSAGYPLRNDDSIYKMEITLDREQLISLARNGVRLWNAKPSLENSAMEKHNRMILCMKLSNDGRYIASGSKDCTVRIWDMLSGECLESALYEAVIIEVAISDSMMTASVLFDKTIVLQRWGTDKAFIALPNTGHVTSLVFSSDNSYLASGNIDGQLIIWFTNNGEEYVLLTGHTSRIEAITFSPSGCLLASASSLDGTARVWDISEVPAKTLGVNQCVLEHAKDITYTPNESRLIVLTTNLSQYKAIILSHDGSAVISTVVLNQGIGWMEQWPRIRFTDDSESLKFGGNKLKISELKGNMSFEGFSERQPTLSQSPALIIHKSWVYKSYPKCILFKMPPDTIEHWITWEDVIVCGYGDGTVRIVHCGHLM